MKKLGRIIENLADLLGHLSGWLVFLMMALVVFEVFMRYVLKRPPMVADEFAGYLLVAISYLGIAYAFKDNAHVRITFVIDKLSPRVSNWFRLITLIMALFFTILLSKMSYNYLLFSSKLNMRSSTWIRFPLIWPQITLMIGFIILSLFLIVRIVKMIKDIKSGD